MNLNRLLKLSKSQLIEMLLQRDSAKSQAVWSASYNPKLTKPKSLVQLAAERIEQSIKQPTKLPEPSKILPTLKTLAAQALVKDKVKFWDEKAKVNASINRLDKKTMGVAEPLLLFQLPE